jgi:beta-1,4-mannosyl-glycoprotein beta-1,4-N-acetylglucosaminyltransferase
MKVFDCFLLLNELDLLEFRIKLLWEHVDHFVICEASHTHSGEGKPYNLLRNWDRFRQYSEKIIYLTAELEPRNYIFKSLSVFTPDDGAWFMEVEHRNHLWTVKGKMADDDLVLLGDIDEIPSLEVIDKYLSKGRAPRRPRTLLQRFHYYYMNLQKTGRERKWCGTALMSGKDFKAKAPQKYRDKRTRMGRIKNGGWHFSYLGGSDQIRYKIKSFSHREYNNRRFTSEEHITASIQGRKDIFGRGSRLEAVDIDSQGLYGPQLVFLMKQYPQFLAQ